MLLTEKNLYYEKLINEFIKLNLYELLEIETNLNIFNLIFKRNEKIFYKDIKLLNENDLKLLSNEFKIYSYDNILNDILNNMNIKEKLEILKFYENEKRLNEFKYLMIDKKIYQYNKYLDNEKLKLLNENELNNIIIETIFKDITNYELYYLFSINC